jgi:UDP-glucose 4-epimerase
VSHVFHLAAVVSVEESMQRPEACVETNVVGTLRLLEAAAAAKVRRVIFSSSAAVYGNRPEPLKTEDLPPDPRSPYAITKLDGELYCRLYATEMGLETVSLRYFNVFGPRQDPASPYAAAVPIFISRALTGEPLEIFGDGQQTRDFIYVEDVARANLLCALHPNASGVYNVGCESVLSIEGLASAILTATGSSSGVRFLPSRPGDLRHSRAGTERLRALGFRPRYTLEEGLALTIAQIRKGQGR